MQQLQKFNSKPRVPFNHLENQQSWLKAWPPQCHECFAMNTCSSNHVVCAFKILNYIEVCAIKTQFHDTEQQGRKEIYVAVAWPHEIHHPFPPIFFSSFLATSSLSNSNPPSLLSNCLIWWELPPRENTNNVKNSDICNYSIVELQDKFKQIVMISK